jgi:uncharacterized protein (TIGR02246 family)
MSDDEQEIRQLVATWMTATKAGDFKTVLGLMTDDVVFLVPGKPPMIGKAAFEASARPPGGQPMPTFEGRSEIQEIKVEGKWACMWNRLTVVVTPPGGGAQKTRSGHTLSILRKQDGKWLLARDANLLSPG